MDFVIEDGYLSEYNGTEENVVIPDGVIEIGNTPFQKNKTLKSVTIPESVEYIIDDAFKGCKNLTDIIMKNSNIVEIGSFAFDGCKNLENFPMPDKLEKICDFVFRNCVKLNDIRIPASVRKIEARAFEKTGYYNNPDNWVDGALYIDNCLVNADRNALPSEYTVKDGTRIIAEDAFKDCNNLESVIIPNSVSELVAFTFFRCMSLKSIIIPNSVTEISSYAFSRCCPDVTIYTPKDSYAQKYAEEYNIKFCNI